MFLQHFVSHTFALSIIFRRDNCQINKWGCRKTNTVKRGYRLPFSNSLYIPQQYLGSLSLAAHSSAQPLSIPEGGSAGFERQHRNCLNFDILNGYLLRSRCICARSGWLKILRPMAMLHDYRLSTASYIDKSATKRICVNNRTLNLVTFVSTVKAGPREFYHL